MITRLECVRKCNRVRQQRDSREVIGGRKGGKGGGAEKEKEDEDEEKRR